MLRALVLTVVLSTLPSLAFAQDAEEPEGLRERAMALFERGRQEIDDGDATAGVASCEQAYGIYPTPPALARLGACYEWAGRTEDAVATYERAFRSSAADANVREFAASAIERITGERPVEVAPEERPAEGPVERQALTPVPTPVREADHTLPWVMTVSAIVLAAAAAGAGIWTYTIWSDLDDQAGMLRDIRASHPPPYTEPEYAALQADIDDRNPTLETLSTVTAILGGAALVAGAVALILWLASD